MDKSRKKEILEKLYGQNLINEKQKITSKKSLIEHIKDDMSKEYQVNTDIIKKLELQLKSVLGDEGVFMS